MPSLKITKNKSGSTAKLENYLKKEEKTNQQLMSGKDCDQENFTKDFFITKNIYDKLNGRQHYHLIQSFKPGETNPNEAHEIGQKLLKHKSFEGFQAVVITHTDKDHIHNHIVINSVSQINGKKFHTMKSDLQSWKNFSDKLAEKKGLSVIPKKEKTDNYYYMNSKEYRVRKNQPILWKDELIEKIHQAKNDTKNINELKENLENYNVQMEIKDKYLLFKNKNMNNYIFDKKLGEEYKKENMIQHYEVVQKMDEIEKIFKGDETMNKSKNQRYDENQGFNENERNYNPFTANDVQYNYERIAEQYSQEYPDVYFERLKEQHLKEMEIYKETGNEERFYNYQENLEKNFEKHTQEISEEDKAEEIENQGFNENERDYNPFTLQDTKYKYEILEAKYKQEDPNLDFSELKEQYLKEMEIYKETGNEEKLEEYTENLEKNFENKVEEQQKETQEM